jgi:hypothetical protein
MANAADFRDLFFPDRPTALAEGRCLASPAGCGRSLRDVPFRDELSAREYQISRLCQECQDKVFGPGATS